MKKYDYMTTLSTGMPYSTQENEHMAKYAAYGWRLVGPPVKSENTAPTCWVYYWEMEKPA